MPDRSSLLLLVANWALRCGGRQHAFRLGLGGATLLFVVSLGLVMVRVTEQYQAEARTQRSGVWLASQAQMEVVRLTALLQRLTAGEGDVGLDAASLQYEIVLSRINLLDSGDGPTEYSETARLRDRLPEIRALLVPVDSLLQRFLAGEPDLYGDIQARLAEVEALLLRTNHQLHLERQAAAETALGGLRSLHWTLLTCMGGLITSTGLLVVLLAIESSRARRFLRHVSDAAGHQRQAERTLRVLIDSLPAMVSAYDDQGRYLFFNEAYGRFHELSEGAAVIGRHPVELGVVVDQSLRQALRGHAAQPFTEYLADDPEGRQRTLLTTSAPVDDGAGSPGRVVHVAFDITDRKEAEDRVRHLAEHDMLTDLPNRLLFANRLRRALVTAGQHKEAHFALHSIDLDGFKEVNDSLGHHGGDRLLIAAAERMRACLRSDDMLARIGGDEFTVIQSHISGPEDVARLAARLVAVLALPFVIDGCTLHSGASIGSVMAPLHGRTAHELQQRGDIALYRAKAEGRGRGILFSPGMEATLVQRRALEADLRQALDKGEFSLVYQPKFAVAPGFSVGGAVPRDCEALLRWNHAERGMVSPAIFVPLAEEVGLAMPLSRFVLRQACAQILAWQAQGLEITVAVNLSAQHFANNQAVALVEEALAASGVPPRLLEVEVTEGVFIRNAAAARSAISALRAQGVRVALDDFGTGYSSLSYLLNLPFDAVKVDRAFVQDLRPGTGSSARIVEAIVRLAHGLGAEVVAEGVERPEQMAMLQQLGCDTVQGFLLGRPMLPEELAGLVIDRSRLNASPGQVA
jgi:diguanylate cyclase (GGDEF)-like protein/PAS domain S-box-containing protein